MSFVKISRLTVRYGKFVAVRDVSFAIPKGAVFGFIGPNGAGKTTTIKVLATLLRPSAGQATIGGLDVVRNARDVRRRIGYVPDSFGLYDEVTVKEYLHFFAAAYALDSKKRRGIIADVLELTDLGPKEHDLVDGLSRGMKQRLGVARVLLHDPDLLLLDEPASGLDPRARIEIRELLKELSSMGKTILISSHILHELSQLCTRVGILEAGKLVAEGALEEIYSQIDLMRVVHVQFSQAPADIDERLIEIPGVTSVNRDVDRISLEVREGAIAPDDLLERIQQLGARVCMFQPQAMDMETAFMKLTEGKTA